MGNFWSVDFLDKMNEISSARGNETICLIIQRPTTLLVAIEIEVLIESWSSNSNNEVVVAVVAVSRISRSTNRIIGNSSNANSNNNSINNSNNNSDSS